MNLLITGGAGFIGSTFANLASQGKLQSISKVYVLDSLTYSGNLKNLKELEKNSNYEFIHGKIEDFKLIDSIIGSIDVILNFAAESHVDRSIVSSKEFVKSNIVGVQNLLDALVKRPTVRFIHISTDEVYGSIKKGKPKEDSKLLPNSPYSASKASADLLIRSYVKTHLINAVITRSSNNYGPRQYPEKFIPTIILSALKGKKVPIYGSGLNVRDWIHVEDNCLAIAEFLYDKSINGIFNIGSNIQISNIDLARKIIFHMGFSEEIIEYVEDRKGHDFKYALNTKKYQKQFGKIKLRDFDSGLADTIRWYSDNKNYFDE